MNENHVKISIIAPVYRVERYIDRCIDSVLSQSLEEWELIMVDDCGGDNSMNVVRDYSKRDQRIKYIESEKNAGPMIAREKGYKASSGEYITFLDSDDTLPENALCDLYAAARGTGADIILGDVMLVGTDGKMTKHREGLQYGSFEKETLIQYLKNGSYPHNLCGKLFKASLLRDQNLKVYDGCTNGEDGLLFYQILDYTRATTVINTIVYYYWMNEGSSTHRALTDKMITGMAQLENYKKSFFLKEGVVLDQSYFRYLYCNISNLATRYPIDNILAIYKNQGLDLDVSFKNLCKFFSGIELLKVIIKIFYVYKLNKVLKKV